MFTTLLESKALKPRSSGEMAVSAALHGLVLFLAIQATLHASQPPAEVRERKVELIDVKKHEPMPPKPIQEAHVPLPPNGFQTLSAPVNIPDVFPAIDLNQRPTNPNDFTGAGAEGEARMGLAVRRRSRTRFIPIIKSRNQRWSFRIHRFRAIQIF